MKETDVIVIDALSEDLTYIKNALLDYKVKKLKKIITIFRFFKIKYEFLITISQLKKFVWRYEYLLPKNEVEIVRREYLETKTESYHFASLEKASV